MVGIPPWYPNEPFWLTLLLNHSQMGNEYWPNGGDALWLEGKAVWFIPLMEKCVDGTENCVSPC